MVSKPFGKPGTRHADNFMSVKRHLKNWIYSWMSTLQTGAEYETSKGLLLDWLDLPNVLQTSKKTIAKNIKDWMIAKILEFVGKYVDKKVLRKGTVQN
jgi:hypothetical protein